jgi:glycoside/pentoside/hexuronide:cation symporter, GPH family
LGLALSNFVLDLAGYINQEPHGPIPKQPHAVQVVLRIFVGPVPGLIILASFAAVHFYPITRAKHAEIRAALAQRHQPS